jgi:hypothetical protein
MNQFYENLSKELSDMPLVAIKLEAQSDNCRLFSQICIYLINQFLNDSKNT